MNHQSRSMNSQACCADCVPRDRAAGLLRNFIAALDAEPAQREPFMNYARHDAERQLAHWEDEATASRASHRFHPEPIGSHGAGSVQKVRTSPFYRRFIARLGEEV